MMPQQRNVKNKIWTSQRGAQHPFAGQNLQLTLLHRLVYEGLIQELQKMGGGPREFDDETAKIVSLQPKPV